MNRTLITFIILTLIAFILVIAPYGCVFTNLSDNNQDWANFGSYVGGTLSPVIATLALFGLGLTIYQQQQQQRINHLESAIRNIESDFKDCLVNTPLTVNNHQCNGYDVLMSLTFPADKVIPKKDTIDLNGTFDFFSDEIRLYETFGAAAGHLNQLRLYVNKHHDLSKTNIMSKYYSRKYKTASRRLIESGYLDIDKTWKSA